MSEEAEHLLKDLAEPVNVYINNPIAKRFVEVLKNTFVTPNQVTYLSVAVGFASGYSFSQGTGVSSAIGGLLLELTLVLDCVDGQLARAKKMASDWGRLIDGIAGYFAYLAVIFGIMTGYSEFRPALIVIAVFTILRAISYDYCKQSLGTMVLQGFDGMDREIQNTIKKIRKNFSNVLIVYFYYMQAQQLIFRGKWKTLGEFRNKENTANTILSTDQRQQYFEKVSILLKLWRWNGIDFPLFIIAVLGVLSMPSQCLNFLAWAITMQFFFTYFVHLYLSRNL
jgi:phosphatidylglycerophosphate synthase